MIFSQKGLFPLGVFQKNSLVEKKFQKRDNKNMKGENTMNKNKLLLIIIGSIFILTVVFLVGMPSTVSATETCFIVTIHGRDNIEPTLLTIKKGDCVVWINFNGSSPGQLMQTISISFKDGKKCIKTTQSPVGFKMDSSSWCYVAGWLGFGETSSLMFVEPGTYDYTVQFKAGGENSGKIIVQ